MCLLAQINPVESRDTEANLAMQLHHAHQVCGIVAHTTDRGVASVAIRSLTIASSVLTDLHEQKEVVTILEKINADTGWRLGKILSELKKAWGWEGGGTSASASGAVSLTAQFLGGSLPQAVITATSSAPIAVPAPVPARRPINPLLVQADFSLPNHPYKNWYEPPNRSNNRFGHQGSWSAQ
jgi:hypothetical protein